MPEAKFNPEDYVYTFEDVVFKINSTGKSYAVAGMSATCQECGIPTMVLTINPKPDAKPDDIEVPSLDEFMTWHADLQDLAATRKEQVTFYLKATCSADTQTIDIKQWVLTQAGILEAGASGSFSTQVVIQHPIVGAASGVLVQLNKYRPGAAGYKLAGNNISDMIIDAIRLSLEHRRPAVLEDPGTQLHGSNVDSATIRQIDVQIYERAVASHAELAKWMVWDSGYSGGLFPFVADTVDIVNKYYSKGGIDTGPYLESRESPYSVYMAMATQMMLMTYGTLSDDPIKVRPSEPWAGWDTYLHDVEVSSVMMPVDSAVRINGTLSMGIATSSDMMQNQYNRAGSSGLRYEDLKIGGAYIEKWRALEGTTKLIGVPEFIAKYMAGTPSSPAYGNEDFQNSKEILMTKSDSRSGDAARAMDGVRVAVMNAYCHDDFWRTYGSDVTLSLVTRFKVGGTTNRSRSSAALRPGNILRVLASSYEPLNTCYITTVQHVISVQDGRAYTTMQGMYARGPTGIKGVYLPSQPVTSKTYRVK